MCVLAGRHSGSMGVAGFDVRILERKAIGPVQHEIVHSDDARGPNKLQTHDDRARGVAHVEGGVLAGFKGNQTRGAYHCARFWIALGCRSNLRDSSGGPKILDHRPHRIPRHVSQRGHRFLLQIEADVIAIRERKVKGGMQRSGRADLLRAGRANGRGAWVVNEMRGVHEHHILGRRSFGHAQDRGVVNKRLIDQHMLARGDRRERDCLFGDRGRCNVDGADVGPLQQAIKTFQPPRPPGIWPPSSARSPAVDSRRQPASRSLIS